MKIVHVIDYFQPMLGYQEAHLARNQARNGHDVCVVTSDRYAPVLYPAAQRILGPRIVRTGHFIEEGISVWRLPVFFEVFDRVGIRGLGRKLLDMNPDLVIAHGVFSIATLQAVSIKRSKPEMKLIVDDHMVEVAARPKFRFAYLFFRLLFSRWILDAADALVATHEETTEFMVTNYGFPETRIEFIPLGCDTTLFCRNQQARKEIRTSHGLSDDDVLFIYAGKLIPVKGPHILVKAAFSLIKENPCVRVLLVGDGTPDYIDMMKKIIHASGFEEHFIFAEMTPNNELHRLYSAADVGVWPLQCSLTMIEAMGCSLPVIIADNSGTPGRVSHGNGYLYHSGDLTDLANRMKTLLDRKQRESMGQNAKAFAENHDWGEISRRFLNL